MSLVVMVTAGILPLLLAIFRRLFPDKVWWSDVPAIAAAVAFFVISSLYVFRVLADGTVLMTTIHRIFLNPAFLVSGFYLGVYGIACLLEKAWKDYKRE